jgi:hypothetical protein
MVEARFDRRAEDAREQHVLLRALLAGVVRDARRGHRCIAQCARERRTTTYHELWPAIGVLLGLDLGNPWRQMPHLLGYISEHSYEDYRLLLTALVVEDGPVAQPGEGFFRLAASMGLLPERAAPPEGVPWRGMTVAQRAFWEGQVEAIFTRFAGTDPFQLSREGLP